MLLALDTNVCAQFAPLLFNGTLINKTHLFMKVKSIPIKLSTIFRRIVNTIADVNTTLQIPFISFSIFNLQKQCLQSSEILLII